MTVGAGVAIALLARSLSWPAAVSPDGFAYAAWGSDLLHGHRLRYDLTSTTPKPLGTLLGALTSFLPAERAFALLAAVALGVAAGAIFHAAARHAGILAGALAASAFVAGAAIVGPITYGLIDAVTAALVGLALASDGRARVAAVWLAGLARPELWPVAAVATWQAVGGSRERRAVLALAAAAVPAVVWALFDLVLGGDALAVLHETDRIAADDPPRSLAGAAAGVARLLWHASSLPLLVVGAAGLADFARRRLDPFPWLATVLVALGLFAELARGLPSNPRYGLPIAVACAVGAGVLVARLLPLRTPGLVALAPIVVAAGLVASWSLPRPAQAYAERVAELGRIAPEVRAAADRCRQFAVDGRRRGVVPSMLAATTGLPLGRFAYGGGGSEVARFGQAIVRCRASS